MIELKYNYSNYLLVIHRKNIAVLMTAWNGVGVSIQIQDKLLIWPDNNTDRVIIASNNKYYLMIRWCDFICSPLKTCWTDQGVLLWHCFLNLF